jgi:hypothetical protein
MVVAVKNRLMNLAFHPCLSERGMVNSQSSSIVASNESVKNEWRESATILALIKRTVRGQK